MILREVERNFCEKLADCRERFFFFGRNHLCRNQERRNRNLVCWNIANRKGWITLRVREKELWVEESATPPDHQMLRSASECLLGVVLAMLNLRVIILLCPGRIGRPAQAVALAGW